MGERRRKKVRLLCSPQNNLNLPLQEVLKLRRSQRTVPGWDEEAGVLDPNSAQALEVVCSPGRGHDPAFQRWGQGFGAYLLGSLLWSPYPPFFSQPLSPSQIDLRKGA